MFPSLSKTHVKEMIPIIIDHLIILQEKLRFYFPSLNVNHYDWIRNPFMEIPTDAGLILAEEEELASISSDRGLKIKYEELSFEKFWISTNEEYPSTARKALSILIQFSTSYLCELGFSSLTNIKCTKRQNIQCVEEDLRVCSSHIRPNIKEIAEGCQAHVSHTHND